MNTPSPPPKLRRLILATVSAVAMTPACHGGEEWQRLGSEAFTEPYAAVEVAAAESGRVAAVTMRRGEQVAAGQLLLELDTSVLLASRKVAAQKAAASARMEALRIDYEQKQRKLETLTTLRRDGAAGAEELRTAEAEMRIAALQIQAAEEDQEQAQLELAEIEARIEERRVRAPFAGVIVDVRREAGEFVAASDPHVATLVDLGRLRVTFYLPTSTALQLHAGDNVSLIDLTEHAPSGRGTSPHPELPGVLEYVAPLTQADSGRVRVDVIVDNAHGTYRSGLRCGLRPQPDAVQPTPRSASR